MDFAGKTILVTGGTGSFGTAFISRILSNYPDTVVRLFSRDELKQSEARARFGSERVRYLIGDVRDRARLTRAAQGASYVIHAAAMKQVPACEYNPFEAVSTNVIGTQNVVDAAIDAGVERVVALSTDKAVNPVNLYGATKLCAEKIVVQGNAYGSYSTRLACVRYGNVVGSRGSVVPLFRRQAQEGRLTITDERMTRFWISLENAVDLVLFALEELTGGEVFIPKIPSTRIVDLADAIAPDVAREVIGIRPGEKLHEVLLTADESHRAYDIGDAYVLLPTQQTWVTDDRWQRRGTKVAEQFSYTSDNNPEWLVGEELGKLIDSIDVHYRRRSDVVGAFT
ncbi:MAG: UDP-N-acetylglucosamine 4,6-dehydratase (inverting) [Actinomycetota bacterium]|nr:UDP-N-acetylglucosamine 4,6-dehydratase (inverting) [Actinomycetota bacterium]